MLHMVTIHVLMKDKICAEHCHTENFTIATTIPQCHISSDCSDSLPANIAPFGDCCDTTGRNSFRLNALGGCISCESRGKSMAFVHV